MTGDTVRVHVDDAIGRVSVIRLVPADADWLYVFAHGAGAGMEHEFMEDMAQRFATAGVATVRYQFPYMEHGRRPPNRSPVLLATVRAVTAWARDEWQGRMVAGGKSMGGRMTSMAQAESPLAGVEGIAFLGFPLHPAKRPSVKRAGHLASVRIPTLFLQGSRDALADLSLLQPVVSELGPAARLHVLEGADHGWMTRKKDGRTLDEVRSEAVGVFLEWLGAL